MSSAPDRDPAPPHGPSVGEVVARRGARPFRILYSQSWEDPEVDAEGLALGAGQDVLAVAASGDNALAFVLREPRSVTAIDLNPTQIHLLELKLAALETLDPDDLHGFLGVRDDRRRAARYAQVRPRLSAAAQGYWDAHQALVERGVIHVGKLERYLRLFQRTLLPLVHSRRTRRRLFELDGLEAQRAFYRDTWNTRRWRLVFRAFFSRFLLERLGRDPAFFAYVEGGSVGEFFLRRFEHALTALPVRDNFFLEYMVLGRYTDPTRRLPPYLRPEHLPTLRERAREVLRWHVTSFEAFLPTQPPARFDACYLSDIFEYMSEPAFAALLRDLARACKPGARLTYRNTLVRREHPPALDDLLEHEVERSRRLHAADRSFVYGNFVVERVR